jgi:hypothetical protein
VQISPFHFIRQFEAVFASARSSPGGSVKLRPRSGGASGRRLTSPPGASA